MTLQEALGKAAHLINSKLMAQDGEIIGTKRMRIGNKAPNSLFLHILNLYWGEMVHFQRSWKTRNLGQSQWVWVFQNLKPPCLGFASALSVSPVLFASTVVATGQTPLSLTPL